MVWQSAWPPDVKLCHDIDTALYDITQLFPLQVKESQSLTISIFGVFLHNCTVSLITLVTLLCTFVICPSWDAEIQSTHHSGYRLTASYVVVKRSFLSCSFYPDDAWHVLFLFSDERLLSWNLRAVNDCPKISFLSYNCLFQTSHPVGTGKLFFFRRIFMIPNLACYLFACSALLTDKVQHGIWIRVCKQEKLQMKWVDKRIAKC